jgi:hypothetical protein
MKQLLLVSSALVLTFGIILGVLALQTNRPLALMSEAKDFKPAFCPIDVTFYVNEINDDGQEVPLTIDKHPDIDVLSWSVIDGQNPEAQPIYFNKLPLIEYALQSKALTFTSIPRALDTYQKGDVAFIKLTHQSDLFSIVKHELTACASPTNPDLCSNNEQVQEASSSDLSTIDNITLDCNMTLKAGWVVQRRSSQTNPLLQSTAPSEENCDLNGDGACNTFDLFIVLDDYGKNEKDLLGDMNRDGSVNALDYTLMTSRISRL